MRLSRIEWFPILLGILFITMISVPYLVAFQAAGESHRFGGFLLNPIDGNSYLAKMQQGFDGRWRFVLPFTNEQGEGAYLFLFYIALGHLARLVGSSTVLIFHLARVVCATLLVISLWHFFKQVFTLKAVLRLAFGLALFASGMGWLAASFGIFSADFWVAEGYPFLSAYANPHFPLGMAIMLWFLAPGSKKEIEGVNRLSGVQIICFIFAGLVLAISMPFGVVIALVVMAATCVWDLLREGGSSVKRSNLLDRVKFDLLHTVTGQKLLILVFSGLPVLIYQYWVTQQDQYFAAWNAQNLTETPPVLDMLIATSPLLLAAIWGSYYAFKSDEPGASTLLVWAIVGILLIYLPWSLQRRFITGLMVPVAGLAAIVLDRLIQRKRIIGIIVTIAMLVLMLPTNLMILLGGFQAVASKAESIYLTRAENDSLMWLKDHTSEHAVILASPEMGLYIPAYTGRKVWYGHPYETPKALQMENELLAYFSGQKSDFTQNLLDSSDYLLYGKRERSLGEVNIGDEFELIFESGDSRIYRID
jgi:hypothetical protein